MRVCLLALTAPFFLLPLGAAPGFELRPEPSAWRFAHPDAQILAGADLFRLGQNPLGEKLRQQFLAAMGPELSRHVQRLLVSTAFAADGSADTVLILSGPLDAARIKQMAGKGHAQIKAYKGVDVILPPSGSPLEVHFAIIDSQTALLGTRAGVTAAIDRNRASNIPPAQRSALFGRALELATDAEVWVLTDDLPAGFAPTSWEQLSGTQTAGVELVLKVGAEIGLAVGFDLDPPEVLEAAFQAIEKERFGTRSGNYALAPWLKKLATARHSAGLVLSGQLSEAEALEEFPALAAILGLPIKSAEPKPTQLVSTLRRIPDEPLPVAPPPPPQLRVRIEGLETGTLEIPYQSKR
jgi:hypothetical protein